MSKKIILIGCLLVLHTMSFAQTVHNQADMGLECRQYNRIGAQDSDFDGLCDGWEELWFGCIAADEQAYIRPWDKSVPYVYPTDCKRADLDGDGFLDFVPNLTEFSASDDPDGDNCNNACEQSNATRPIDDQNTCSQYPEPFSLDSDEDGLCDGWELWSFGCVSADGLTYIRREDDVMPYVYSADCATANFHNSNGSVIYYIVPNLAQYSGIDDPDEDGCVNLCEYRNGTLALNTLSCDSYASPYNQDNDADNLCDGWELEWFGCIALDSSTIIRPWDQEAPYIYPDDCRYKDGYIVANLAEFSGADDFDNDGCSNYCEAKYDSNPTMTDSDDDSLTDGEEVTSRLFMVDYIDVNGVNQSVRKYLSTSPSNPDTDGDGLKDNWEWTGDYTGTVYESLYQGIKTGPTDYDTDDDWVYDGAEMDLRLATDASGLLNPLNGQLDYNRILATIPDDYPALREVLQSYWNISLDSLDSECPRLCQAIALARNNAYAVRASDDWLRLYIDPIGNGADSINIAGLFNNEQSEIVHVGDDDVYEVWIAIPYLAEVVFNADIEAIRPYSAYDMNLDTIVSPTDIIFVINRIGNDPLSGDGRADVDHDNDIDIADVQMMLNYLNSLP